MQATLRRHGARLGGAARQTTGHAQNPPVFRAVEVDVYPYGVPSDDPATALFRRLSFTVADGSSADSTPADCWAILTSSSNKSRLISTLRAQVRFSPPAGASHPILAGLPPRARSPKEGPPVERQVSDIIKLVSFKTRLTGAAGAGFSDFTSRYFHLREEEQTTLRQELETHLPYGADVGTIDELAAQLQLSDLLDLAQITLSNGQTRRARILRALLSEPEMVLLILDEPYTGLDVASRASLTTLFEKLHALRSPRILFALRPQDGRPEGLPSFVSHLAIGDREGEMQFGEKDLILASAEGQALLAAAQKDVKRSSGAQIVTGKDLVVLKNVDISYSDRKVLVDINWTVKEGERWILAGHNGSGKSTLLSLILGDHPLSFTQNIELFGRPRAGQATTILQSYIGQVSPELFHAFPRTGELTVKDVVVTGLNSIYCYRTITPSQQIMFDRIVHDFDLPSVLTPDFFARLFQDLTPSEQSLVLLIRALCGERRLLILDEPFSFMDAETVAATKLYLNTKLRKETALIVISHFEEELPSCVNRRLELSNGRILEMI